MTVADKIDIDRLHALANMHLHPDVPSTEETREMARLALTLATRANGVALSERVGLHALAEQRLEIAALRTRAEAAERERDDAMATLLGDRDRYTKRVVQLTDRAERAQAALEKIRAARREWITSHYMHFDREGNAGRTCPACIADHALRRALDDAACPVHGERTEGGG